MISFIFMIAALCAPADATRVSVQPVDAAVTAAVDATIPATAPATGITGRRGELTRSKPLQPELIVSIGRFRWSWPNDARELVSRLKGLAGALCLAASVLPLVDTKVCREELAVRLQDTFHYVTAYLFAESRP